MSEGQAAAGPLAGVRVVELATVIMAPYACQVLGDLGAEVIKVEDMGKGDSSRVMGGGPHPELSGIALNLHRNKRSIQLDLTQPEGRATLGRLLDSADVFVTNLRPKALEKLGLDHASVCATRSHLVYCEAHGFSVASGDADRPAFDDIVQGATGLPGLVERTTGVMSFFPSIIADKLTGLTMVYSVVAALLHRANTGVGQRVEVPMFDTVLSFNLVEHLAQAAVPGGKPGYRRIVTTFRGPHRTKDGYIALMPYYDKDWENLYRAVGHDEELEQPWFKTHEERLQNPDKVYGSLQRILTERTTAEWLELAEELGIPVGPVASLDDIVNHAEDHRGVLTLEEHPIAGTYRSIEPPVRFDHSPMSVRSAAPLLGQDTVRVLSELGLSEDEIRDLLARGVVRQGSEPTA